jgi:hypothetical protein
MGKKHPRQSSQQSSALVLAVFTFWMTLSLIFQVQIFISLQGKTTVMSGLKIIHANFTQVSGVGDMWHRLVW